MIAHYRTRLACWRVMARWWLENARLTLRSHGRLVYYTLLLTLWEWIYLSEVLTRWYNLRTGLRKREILRFTMMRRPPYGLLLVAGLWPVLWWLWTARH